MTKRATIILIGAVLVVLFLCLLLLPRAAMQPQSALHTIQLTDPAGATLPLHVEYAVTPAEQEKGLMNRTSIGDDGMLFLFDHPQQLTFWMKDTLIPLDIVFFGRDGTYVSSATMQPCTKDPCQVYSSGRDAMYGLELPEGFIARHGVGEGWGLVK